MNNSDIVKKADAFAEKHFVAQALEAYTQRILDDPAVEGKRKLAALMAGVLKREMMRPGKAQRAIEAARRGDDEL